MRVKMSGLKICLFWTLCILYFFVLTGFGITPSLGDDQDGSQPSRIIDHLSSKMQVTVQEGETVELVCNVTGVPQPMVNWYRIPTGLLQESEQDNRSKKQIGVAGEVLVIHNVTRYCDDVYECVAFNNVPPPASRRVRVYVEFPPEVRLPNQKIGQSKGKTTILECVVTAYPQAITAWSRHGKVIERNSKYNIEVYDESDNTLTLALRIQQLAEEDYGQYECVSRNILGSDSETMILYEYPVMERTTPPTTTTTQKTTSKYVYGSNGNRDNGRNSHEGLPSGHSQLGHNSDPRAGRVEGGGGNGGDQWPHNRGQNSHGNNDFNGQGIRNPDPTYALNGGNPRNDHVIVEPGSGGVTVLWSPLLVLSAVIVSLAALR